MFRAKTIIRCRKGNQPLRNWYIKMGKRGGIKPGPGIYKLFTLLCYILEDKEKIYSLDIVIKRKK